MKNRMTARVFCLLAAFLGGCGDIGIFKAISEETELNSDPSAPGNILSIVRYGDALYAAGGRIYRKDNYTQKGGWSESSKPDGLVVRLAAGYSGEEYLYALTASTGDSGNPTYRLYYFPNATGDWEKMTDARLKNLRTIFSNHAAPAEKNRAYATTSEGVFELSGGEVAGSVDATDDNGASSSSVAAAYIGSAEDGATYFADTAAFASDGEHLFQGDGTKISYGADTLSMKEISISGISNTIMSLWAHKTEENTGTLYIGTVSGIKTVPYNTATGAPEPYNPATGKPEATSPGNATSTALGNYEVPAVFVTAGGEAVYASTVGTTATQGTKKNGLWGYYPGRDTWDWE